jgi:uncharacterized membrane-anchored protein
MIRVLIFTLCVAAAALAVAWLSDGTVTVEWLGYQVKTSALIGTLVSVALAVLFILLGGLLRYLVTRWTRRRSSSSKNP